MHPNRANASAFLRVSAFLRMTATASFCVCMFAGTVASVTAPLFAQTVAYVVSTGADALSIIDVDDAVVTATIPLAAGSAPSAVAVDSRNRIAYVTNTGINPCASDTAGTVSIVDIQRNSVTGSITVGSGPLGIALTPDARSVYVANLCRGTVSVIDAVNRAVTATISFGSTFGPSGVAVTPDGNQAYVAVTAGGFPNGFVGVIDAHSNAVTQRIAAFNPVNVAASGDGRFIFVADALGEETLVRCRVLIIDTATMALTATIALPLFIDGIGVDGEAVAGSLDGSRAYVPDRSGARLLIVDTAARDVVAQATVGAEPRAVAVSPDGTRVLVTNYNSNDVSVIDAADNSVIATIPVSNGPLGIAMEFRRTPQAADFVPDGGDGCCVPGKGRRSSNIMVLVGLLAVGTAGRLWQGRVRRAVRRCPCASFPCRGDPMLDSSSRRRSSALPARNGPARAPAVARHCRNDLTALGAALFCARMP